MTLHGHVQNGTIVLDEQFLLPEGAAVEVQIVAPQSVDALVRSNGDEIPTVAERLKDFIGILKDAPEDAARNHDHYLYGAPKQ